MKTPKSPTAVIPANAGIQKSASKRPLLDPRVRGDDGRSHSPASLYGALALCGFSMACAAASPFTDVDYGAVSPEMTKEADASGAVVLESSTLIEFAAGDEKNPRATPTATVTRFERILITADAGAGFGTQVLEAPRGERLDAFVVRGSWQDDSSEILSAVDPDDDPPKPIDAPARLKLSRAEPGSIVDVYSRVTYADAALVPTESFAHTAPTRLAKLRIIGPTDFEIRFAVGRSETINRSPDLHKRDIGGGKFAWDFEERNVAPVTGGLMSVAPERNSPWVSASVGAIGVDEERRPWVGTWEQVGRWLDNRVAPSTALSEEFVAAVPAGLPKAQLRHVRQALAGKMQTTPLWAVMPRNIDDVPFGKVTALELAAAAAAATSLGAGKAFLALAAPFGGAMVFDDFSGLQPFTRVLVAYEEDGAWVLVDLACSTCEHGRLPTSLAGGRALVLSDAPEVIDIPLRSMEKNARSLQFDWAMSVDGGLTGSFIADLTGIPARRTLAALGDAENETLVARAQEVFLGGGPSIREVVERGEPRPGRSLAMSFSVEGKLQPGDSELKFEGTGAQLAGDALSWAIPVGHRGDLRLPAPARFTDTATLELPTGYVAKVPKPAKIKNRYGSYEARYDLTGTTLTYTRRVGLFAHVVQDTGLKDLAAFVKEVHEADSRIIRIRAVK